MAVELRSGDYGDRNIQYGGSRSPRRQEKLPPGGIRGTRWADLADESEVHEPRQRPKKEEYGAKKLPKLVRIDQLNELDAATVKALVKQGKVDHLITDIRDLRSLSSDVLQVLFQHGRDPNPNLFNGSMRGTDLAAPHHDESWFGKMISGIMTSFRPWTGKQTTSRPDSETEGTGNNNVFGKWIFNFNWNLVESKLGNAFAGDGAKVIRLDYGTPDDRLNRLLGVNCVHDEVREVGPQGSGVMLGMAALVDNSPVWTRIFNGLLSLAGREERVSKQNDPVPVIYFGLQGNQPK